MDKLCTARVYMPYKACTVLHGRARESAASPASPGDAPHAVSASSTAQSAPTCQSRRPSFTFDVQGHGGSDLHRLLA
jgi:hypothetical protein